jgi:hypothetical protein
MSTCRAPIGDRLTDTTRNPSKPNNNDCEYQPVASGRV